jgi:hypothetical protein
VRVGDGWAERRVGLDEDGASAFGLTPAPDMPPASAPSRRADGGVPRPGRVRPPPGRLIAEAGGAALLIDYGRDRPDPGDTLQALRAHEKVSPCEAPGHADLTVWADFPDRARHRRAEGAAVTEILTQREFLRRLGVETRAEALIAANPDREPFCAVSSRA